ncbi:MAG: glycosyltransferase family 2 protein [Candidatus Omnitrophota bacterium]|nr:glycosyltransferase family 2 protein [Candidatus Omnitrophota bacterium]
MSVYLSVIIPAYNEEGRIGPTLSKVYEFLRTKDYDWEVILVDDGSSDNTVIRAQDSELAKIAKLKIINNGTNKGKGFSVKNGILNSSGEYILFSDADLSTPIEEADKLFSYIKKGCDIVIGSRSIAGADVKVHQPFYREWMGRIFNFLVNMLLIKGFNDTQCGFKLFKGNVARELGKELTVNGFCFDVEMLYLAGKKGYRIAETGIIWENSPQSKVRVINSSLAMFIDLFKIKRRNG